MTTKQKEVIRRQTQLAITRGIIKKRFCDMCGKPTTVAHHKNYTDWFDVMFLCPRCHLKLHRSMPGCFLKKGKAEYEYVETKTTFDGWGRPIIQNKRIYYFNRKNPLLRSVSKPHGPPRSCAAGVKHCAGPGGSTG